MSMKYQERSANSNVVKDISSLRNLISQKPPECIVIPGHSIEERKVNKWVTTRLIQELNENGRRTGVRNPKLLPNDPKAYVGGGTAVTLAAAQLFEDMNNSGVPPKLIILAAGRPAYLERIADSSITESIPMKARLIYETGARDEDIAILDKGRTTRDDVERSIELAFNKGMKSVAFILLDIRIERAHALLDETVSNHPQYRSVNITFVPAEILLEERYASHPRLFKQLLAQYEQSAAYAATEKRERGGTDAIRKKEYKGKGQY